MFIDFPLRNHDFNWFHNRACQRNQWPKCPSRYPFPGRGYRDPPGNPRHTWWAPAGGSSSYEWRFLVQSLLGQSIVLVDVHMISRLKKRKSTNNGIHKDVAGICPQNATRIMWLAHFKYFQPLHADHRSNISPRIHQWLWRYWWNKFPSKNQL